MQQNCEVIGELWCIDLVETKPAYSYVSKPDEETPNSHSNLPSTGIFLTVGSWKQA